MPRRERERELARRRKRREKRRKLRAKGLLPPQEGGKTESSKETVKKPDKIVLKEVTQDMAKESTETPVS